MERDEGGGDGLEGHLLSFFFRGGGGRGEEVEKVLRMGKQKRKHAGRREVFILFLIHSQSEPHVQNRKWRAE